MRFEETKLPGVFFLKTNVFNDNRGFFREIFRASDCDGNRIPAGFVQVNMSVSAKGVIRGLHYQLRRPQSKLVSVAHGRVYDVVLDCRSGSPNFGQWQGFELTASGGEQLYIPRGFAHGFQALEDGTAVVYQCDDYYQPGDEFGINVFSPELGVDWVDSLDVIMSDKDRKLPEFSSVLEIGLPVYKENE